MAVAIHWCCAQTRQATAHAGLVPRVTPETDMPVASTSTNVLFPTADATPPRFAAIHPAIVHAEIAPWVSMDLDTPHARRAALDGTETHPIIARIADKGRLVT